MKLILFVLVILGFASCSLIHRKASNDTKTKCDSLNINYPSSADINFSNSLSEFVQAIDLEKLCNPVRIFIGFSVDTAGKISNVDFIPRIFENSDCSIDSAYLEKLQGEFEKSMPVWKPEMNNDSITKNRYIIPVIFE